MRKIITLAMIVGGIALMLFGYLASAPWGADSVANSDPSSAIVIVFNGVAMFAYLLSTCWSVSGATRYLNLTLNISSFVCWPHSTVGCGAGLLGFHRELSNVPVASSSVPARTNIGFSSS